MLYSSKNGTMLRRYQPFTVTCLLKYSGDLNRANTLLMIHSGWL